ncbi:MAG TPA: ANTAR domain-containing protein [Propionibacteriaceae bacterium]|nr:ANTAR domain-containing protein [Propionibacteriaceae bacterium]
MSEALQFDDGDRWSADKREFVADDRDEIADEREAIADEREAIADARERAAQDWEDRLHRWELELNAHAEAVGGPAAPSRAGAARADEGSARARAAAERDEARRRRAQARQDREAATHRRLTQSHPTLLAQAFAQIADRLYEADSYDEVISRIAEAAVATVAGGELASVTLHGEQGYWSVGATGQQALDVDQEQYEAGEGPCLDAFEMGFVDAPSFPDPRWPVLGSRPVAHGVESSVSYRMTAVGHRTDPAEIGSLNVYATTREAFDATAVEIGSILAAHASLAARAIGERAELEDLERHLQRALLSRDTIGQAKGILMERLKTTPEEAFEILRRSSQRLNVKLRDVALRVTQTGEINGRDVNPERR